MNHTLVHLACIMDGNRRWAHARGLPSFVGHKEGVTTLKNVVQFCLERSIRYVSFYAFSLENLQRSIDEKQHVFNLILEQAVEIVDDLQQQGIQVRFVGNYSLFPAQIQEVADRLAQETADGKRLRVDLLFCYSGQQEIVHAVRAVAEEIQRYRLPTSAVTQEMVEKKLWTYDTPSPDLIIRTGGYQRLSGFQLFHAAYAELRFLDCMWPELTMQELGAVVDNFYLTQRRFGR